MEIVKNQRGFARGEFKDSVGHNCKIREGGMDTNEGLGVWLGIENPTITIFTDKSMAHYINIPTPENWNINSMMYLSDKQIRELIPMLKKFLKSGKIQ